MSRLSITLSALVGAAKAAIQVVVDVRPPEAKARDPDGGRRVGPAWPGGMIKRAKRPSEAG